MSKYFIIFLAIFALVGIGYRLNLNMKHSVSAVLQKTYTNDELGISFRYPEYIDINIGMPIIIPNDTRVEDVLVESTILDPKGDNPLFSKFKKENGKNITYYIIQTTRFEGLIAYRAYILKDNFLIPIDYHWMSKQWMDQDYNPTQDAHYVDFTKILHDIELIHTEKGDYEGAVQKLR